jgi:hypothetical protein
MSHNPMGLHSLLQGQLYFFLAINGRPNFLSWIKLYITQLFTKEEEEEEGEGE